MLAFEDVSKVYDRRPVVDHVTLTVGEGMVCGLIGRNGAGKTTMLRLLTGLVHPSGGSASVAGRPYRQIDQPMREVGVALEHFGLHPRRSGRAHLRALALAAEIPRSRVDEVLETADLTSVADRECGGYSLGMRQRLGLAQALLGDPPALVLDEPGTGLDPAGLRWLRDAISGFRSDGRTILVSTHLLSELDRVVTEVAILHHGRLKAHGPPERFSGQNGPASRARVQGDPTGLVESLERAGATVTVERELLRIEGLDAPAVGRAAAASQIPLAELGNDDGGLEKLFLEATADSEQDGSAA